MLINKRLAVNILNTTLFCSFLLLVFLLSVGIDTANAQTTCGNIIDIDDGEEYITPVDDCSNPFNADSDYVANGTLFFDGEEITDGAELPMEFSNTVTASVEFDNPPFYYFVDIYQPQGQDFRLVSSHSNYQVTFTEPGEYVAVIGADLNPPIFGQKTGWQKIVSFFVPTAWAYYDDYLEVKAVHFTVVEQSDTCTSECYSNILFLPGIQASRLYTDGVFGSEDKLWEPNNNADVKQLSMTADGISDNDVYTRDPVDHIPLLGTVYGGLADFLNGLKADNTIVDWSPYAYDWRYDVFDIAKNGTKYPNGERKYLTDVVNQLASTSLSQKVTIVAHSNGGLLAKALLIEHPELSDKIDRIIFIGTPQLGTPKAIGVVLHGFEQEIIHGLILSDRVAREVTTNLPGAYSLVPSQAYFDTDTNPIVTFDDSDSTAAFRNAYGDAINDVATLESFMAGAADGRTANPDTIEEASRANADMLHTALVEHRDKLDNWVATSSIEINQIVGVGLDTVRGFAYKEFEQQHCLFSVFCNTSLIYEPTPLITQSGDQTVVSQSASGYLGDGSTYYFDVRSHNVSHGSDFKHFNLTETQPIQKTILDLLTQQTVSASDVNTGIPTFYSKRELLGTHSPVSMYIEDEAGNVTGRQSNLQEKVPGSTYFELASSTYIIVPQGTKYTVHIEGTGQGSMTFTVDDLEGESQTEAIRVSVDNITTSSDITLQNTGTAFTDMQVDFNGDGIVDKTISPDKEEEVEDPDNDAAAELCAVIEDLHIKKAFRRSLLRLAKVYGCSDKHGHFPRLYNKFEKKVLAKLEKRIKHYERKGWLDSHESESVLDIIKILKSKY